MTDEPRGRSSNVLVYLPDDVLDLLSAASHSGNLNGADNASQSAIVAASFRAHLPQLEAQWNDGEPFDVETGRKMRESRRRPRTRRRATA